MSILGYYTTREAAGFRVVADLSWGGVRLRMLHGFAKLPVEVL